MALQCNVLHGYQAMTNRFKWLVKAAACSLLIFAIVAVYYAQSQYFRTALNDVPIEHMTCNDLVRGCDVDDVHIRFDRQTQVMQPFHLEIKTAEAEHIYARFTMVGMQMGFNRYRLLHQTSGVWFAEIVLPVCVESRSDWLMDIEITKPSLIKPNPVKRYQLSFTSNGGRAHSLRPE
jgi:hypothetical protein